MGFLKKVGHTLSTVVDFHVDRWFNLKGHQETVSYFTKLTKELFRCPPLSPPNLPKEQSFEAIVEREGLSDEWLQQKAVRYQFFSRWFVVAAILLAIYTLVLIYFGNWMAICINITLIIYTLSAAFRFHFLYFQIIKRQLECTPKEWLQFMIKTTKYSMSIKNQGDCR